MPVYELITQLLKKHIFNKVILQCKNVTLEILRWGLNENVLMFQQLE